jgi:hypothetical protein
MTWVEVNGGSGLDDLLKWEKTFAQCYYEIVDALYTIAGLVDRLAGFMKNNEKFIRTIVGVCETHENYIAEEYNTLKLVDSAKRLIG